MKKSIIVLVSFLLCICSSIGDEKTVEYFRSDYFMPFKYDNKSDSISISKLMEISLSDTINNSFLWYDENLLDSIWMHRSNECSRSEKLTSFKLKSYYWILLILYKEEYDSNNVCIFYNKNHQPIFDYRIIGSKGTKNIDLFGIEFFIKDNNAVKALEDKFNNWFRLFNTMGLGYLKENEIYPIEKNEFLILDVHWH